MSMLVHQETSSSKLVLAFQAKHLLSGEDESWDSLTAAPVPSREAHSPALLAQLI